MSFMAAPKFLTIVNPNISLSPHAECERMSKRGAAPNVRRYLRGYRISKDRAI
jgi:hypothetical protein